MTLIPIGFHLEGKYFWAWAGLPAYVGLSQSAVELTIYGMSKKQVRCADCDGGVLIGDGRCSRCHGSGVNLNLASSISKCLSCDGTGVCRNCDGTGLYPPYPDWPAEKIQTLFH